MTSLKIVRPDDWHLHLRDDAMLAVTVPAAARYFGRAIIMPNLKPPVTTTDLAAAYRDRILAAVPDGSTWQPLMTLYLTDHTDPDEITRGSESGIVTAVKYYPAGATTNSASGVTAMKHTYPALEAMQEAGMPLLIHGEVTDPEVDIFDREAVFIERHLIPLMRDFPELKVVLEHITTKDAADYISESNGNLAATITPQHLLFNRNQMLVGGIKPHYFCLPILKRDTHRKALLTAATSGDKRFFLGTDSAPHLRSSKETSCGCAGCYSNHAALELYAEAFASVDALDKLEGFASLNGPAFYGLPQNTDYIQLEASEWLPPESIDAPGGELVPLRADQPLLWKVVEASS